VITFDHIHNNKDIDFYITDNNLIDHTGEDQYQYIFSSTSGKS